MNDKVRKEVNQIVKKSGSSFYWGMRLLPKEKRDAMFCIYAFCRIIDDIVDEPSPMEQKHKDLLFWRREVKNAYRQEPTTLVGQSLSENANNFNLDENEFYRLIEGVSMDLPVGICAPSFDKLYKYCRGVAGAVGMLSIKVFGCDDENAKKFAVVLGEALQLTNILRDPYEDMKMGRLYLPREILEEEGIKIGTPKEILTNGNIGRVREKLAVVTQEKFDEANRLLEKIDAKKIKPAIIMMNIYYDIFKKMEKRGWDVITPKPKTNKMQILYKAFKIHLSL